MAPPAPGAGAPAVDRTRRLDTWRDLIRDHFVALDIDAARPDEFAGAVRATRVGHLDVATVDSTSQVCRRSPALARRDDAAYLQVGLLARGAARLSQDGRDAELRPGCYAVYETDRPFVWDLHGEWRLHVFTWARPTVGLAPDRSRELTARALGGSPGLPGIVGRMLGELGASPPQLTPAGGIRLADEVAELVATAAAEACGGEPAPAPDLLRRIEAYLAEHLADPDLGPARVAGAHYLSTRSLHRVYAGAGTTVTRRIRRLRLERCRRELADPRLRDVPVAEIGRRWGFPDAAAFSRSFRAAYRTTPSAYRAAHAGRG